jgi:hypothetical protein
VDISEFLLWHVRGQVYNPLLCAVRITEYCAMRLNSVPAFRSRTGAIYPISVREASLSFGPYHVVHNHEMLQTSDLLRFSDVAYDLYSTFQPSNHKISMSPRAERQLDAMVGNRKDY